MKRVTKQGTPEQQKRAVHETFQMLEMGVSNVQIFIPYFKLIDMWGTPEQCAKIIEMARPCLNAEPHNEFLWATYLLLVVRRGNTEQLTTAHRLAESWLLAHPQSTNTYILDSYGNILLKLGLHQKAEVLFRRVLKRDKSYVPSRIGLGWSLYHRGKKEEAYQTLLYCQQQVESGSKYPIEGIFLNLGQYWMLEGIIDKAIACFQAGIHSNPHYQQYLALGQAFLALKDYTQARQALQKAKDLLSETIALEAHPEIYQEIDLLFADM